MSAFLGPIHFWLYNKVKIQNDIVENILSSIAEDNLKNKLKEKYGDEELKPLDEVIDVTNIHGWLQQRVSLVENKLAFTVTEILNNNSEKFEELKDIFKASGAEVSTLDSNSSLEEAYKAFNDSLLDGMPCDHANTLVSQENDEIIWKRNVCVHQDYWDANNGDISNYYLLRDELIKGLLSETNIKYEKIDDITSKISK